MNCKPGDLAVIVALHAQHPDSAGRLVDVLYAAPGLPCTLPDGTPSDGGMTVQGPAWVIRLHSPMKIMWLSGVYRDAIYAVCPDAKLRPIRDPGEDAVDETLQRLPAPRDEVTA